MSQSNTYSLSISIVLFDNEFDDLKVLFKSLVLSTVFLKQQGQCTDVDLFLIDNTEPSSSFLQSEVEGFFKHYKDTFTLTFLNGQGNIGFGRAHNLCISRAASDYHLILNPDIELSENALYQASTYLASNNAVVALNPKAFDFQGNQQFLVKSYPSLFILLLRAYAPSAIKKRFCSRLNDYEMRHLSATQASTGLAILSGCFLFCRTKPLQEIEGFDKNFFLYFEDFDLSIRLSEIGALAYNPAIVIKHSGGNTARKGLRHFIYFTVSAFKFFNKQGWKLW